VLTILSIFLILKSQQLLKTLCDIDHRKHIINVRQETKRKRSPNLILDASRAQAHQPSPQKFRCQFGFGELPLQFFNALLGGLGGGLSEQFPQ
jgi:hypothetical protein